MVVVTETKYVSILTRALHTIRSSQAINLLVQSAFLPFYMVIFYLYLDLQISLDGNALICVIICHFLNALSF